MPVAWIRRPLRRAQADVTTLLRLALRDLRHQRAFSVFFVANLALGLAGSMALDGLQSSIGHALMDRSQALMGADFMVASNRPLTAGEITAMETVVTATARSELAQLYSMVRGEGVARLTEVRAIDEHFPLRGAVVLARRGTVDDEARRNLASRTAAWADAALLGQLGVAVGDSVYVGEQSFRIVDTIERDTGTSVRAASLAPRLYIAREHLAATGLVRAGSRIEYHRIGNLADGADAREAARAMRAVLTDPALSVRSHDEAAQRLSGAYERVTRYLDLIALVALTLAGVACAYLFRAFLRRRVVDLAILMTLGAPRHRARALLLAELVLLGAVAAAAAATLATLLLPLAAALLGDLLPEAVLLRLHARQIASGFAIALLVGPVTCLPLLYRIGGLRVAELFQEHASLALQRRRAESIWYLPAVGLLAALAVRRVGDLEQGLGFVAMLAIAFVVIAGCGRALLGLAGRLENRGPIALRLALRQLAPRRRASLTAFVALAACAVLLSLPPQLRAVLDRRLAPPSAETIPSLFLFDIQPEQTEPLRAKVRANGTELQRLAPMVRARLLAINGALVADYKPTTDGESGFRGRDRMRPRGYTLTWQASRAATETLVAGHDFSGTFDESSGSHAEASLEEDWARDLGVTIGDTMRFDVQGVTVETRIVNLRRVDWNSMQPNFFVSLQPGVLEDAPAVYLASVAALRPDEREALQATLVEEFPNVSIIDVSRGVERMLGLIDQMQWALAATALTSLAVGIALVFAIAVDQAQVRRWDVNLMKVLGARHRMLSRSLDLEFAVLGLAAAFVGTIVALGVGAAVATFLVDVPWIPAWRSQALLMLLLPITAAVAARLSMQRVLAEKPIVFLR
jgi:putative ABC transport system permease protein